MVRFSVECTLPFTQEQFWRVRAARSFFAFIVSDGLLKSCSGTEAEYDADGWGTRVQEYTPANVHCPDIVRAIVGDTMFAVKDEQRWNDTIAPYEQHYFIRPSFLSGLSRTSGLLTLREHPEDPELPDSSDADDVDMAAPADHIREADASSSGSLTDPDADGSDLSDAEPAKDPADALLDSLPAADKCIHVVSGETRVSILTVGWFVERAIVHNLRLFYKDYPATVARFRQKIYADFAKGDTSVPADEVIDRFLKHDADTAPVPPENPVDREPLDIIADKMLPAVSLEDPESVFVDA